MRFLAFSLSLLILLAGCKVSVSSGENTNLPPMTSGTAEQRAEAESSARAFIAMIDRGQYDETWDLAGSALRGQSSRFAWASTLRLARSAFSAPPTREIDGFGFTTRIDPGVPAGEYVLVQFKEVAGQVTTTEKVVMQKEQASWRIIGYFIHKQGRWGGGA